MSTLTKEWLQLRIAELEEERDATPGAVNEDAAMALAAMKLALASIEAESKPRQPELSHVIYHFRDWNEGFPIERFKADYVISWMLANYPPAQPAAVSVPDDVSGPLAHAYKELTPTFMRNHIDVFERYGIYPDGSTGIQAMRIALDGMNRRAAMLQGAEQPQNAPQNIPENIPSTQFKPVADLYEVTVPGGRSTTFTKDAAESSDCRVMGWTVQEYVKLERYQVAMLQGADSELQRKAAIHDALCQKYNVESLEAFIDWQRNHISELEAAPPAPVGEGETAVMPDYQGYTMTQRECFQAGKEAGLAEAGNSPVVPDGWVMVPAEPTEDMIVHGFESEPDESFSDEKEWEEYEAMSGCQQAAHRAKLCWAAMIAAAPKPE